MELKWAFAIGLELAFWVMLAAFLILRYRYRVSGITPIFIAGVVLDTAGILALGIWDYVDSGKISGYTLFIVVLIAYSLTLGKRDMRRLDRWMAAKVRPSRRVRG